VLAAPTAVLLTTKLLCDDCAVELIPGGSPVTEEAEVNGPLPNSEVCPTTDKVDVPPTKFVATNWERGDTP
jgi:hypothetical protein